MTFFYAICILVIDQRKFPLNQLEKNLKTKIESDLQNKNFSMDFFPKTKLLKLLKIKLTILLVDIHQNERTQVISKSADCIILHSLGKDSNSSQELDTLIDHI